MSRKTPMDLQEVRVDALAKSQAAQTVYTGRPKNTQNFVYVNPAYVGSVNSVSARIQDPPTSVIREQYCVCSRWPFTQRILAAAVGLLVGAVIGLAVSMALRTDSDTSIGGIFRSSAPD